MTLAWIAFDAITLNSGQWLVLAFCRVIATVTFLLLAVAPKREPNRCRALIMLGIMLARPVASFIARSMW